MEEKMYSTCIPSESTMNQKTINMIFNLRHKLMCIENQSITNIKYEHVESPSGFIPFYKRSRSNVSMIQFALGKAKQKITFENYIGEMI
jgi:hypothetical protein